MSAEYAGMMFDSKVPVKPSKPKVFKVKGAWVLNTGLRYVVIHDTWGDAVKHAERICDGYEDRLYDWIAAGNY